VATVILPTVARVGQVEQERAEVDLLVLGGGGAGLTAARAGCALGARIMVVTEAGTDRQGVWTETLPLRALVGAALTGASFAEVTARVREVRARTVPVARAQGLRRQGIDVRSGSPRFLGSSGGAVEVLVTDPAVTATSALLVRARRVVVATGTVPRRPQVSGIEEVRVLFPQDLLDLPDLPHSLVVLGGGATGCELAQAFARLGTKVTLVEARPRLLSREEPEGGAAVEAALVRDGVRVLTGATVTALAPTLDDGAWVGTDVGEDVAATHLVLATGRAPATVRLSLDAVGVLVTTTGAIRVDRWLRTTHPAIFAAGGVTGLAVHGHGSHAMGLDAARSALRRGGRRWPARRGRRPGWPWEAAGLPRVTFTDPPVAGVGLREADAVARPGTLVCPFPTVRTGAGVLSARSDTLVKIVVGRSRLGLSGTRPVESGPVLGACVVGPGAGDVIAELALAVRLQLPARVLAELPHAFPTWSLGVPEALTQLFADDGELRVRPAGMPDPRFATQPEVPAVRGRTRSRGGRTRPGDRVGTG